MGARWEFAGWAITVVSSIIGAAWWLEKGELANSEIKGLRAENDALKVNVRLAETASTGETKSLQSQVAAADKWRQLEEREHKTTLAELKKAKAEVETSNAQLAKANAQLVRGDPQQAIHSIGLALGSTNNAIVEVEASLARRMDRLDYVWVDQSKGIFTVTETKNLKRRVNPKRPSNRRRAVAGARG